MNTIDEILIEFKKNFSTWKLFIRYISFPKRLILYCYLIGVLVFVFAGILLDNNWMLLPTIIIEIIFFIHLTIMAKKIKSWKYGTTDEFQKRRYDLLIEILKKHCIYHENDTVRTKEKLSLLLSTINTKLSVSKKSIPIAGLLLAILTTLTKILIDLLSLNSIALEVIIIIILALVMILGILIMLLPLVNELINRDWNKLDELRGMLIELMFKRLL